MLLETSFLENFCISWTRRTTSSPDLIPPFGDRRTDKVLSNWSGSIRGILDHLKRKKPVKVKGPDVSQNQNPAMHEKIRFDISQAKLNSKFDRWNQN